MRLNTASALTVLIALFVSTLDAQTPSPKVSTSAQSVAVPRDYSLNRHDLLKYIRAGQLLSGCERLKQQLWILWVKSFRENLPGQ
ncbi:MAG: hypothetical protein JXA73_20255 [Acidobacteria bacterium]|nr:hypothetical protein [Acidobacteriota bacterium]